MPLWRYQSGGGFAENLVFLAVIVVYGVMLLVAFSQSLVAGFGMVGFTIAMGALLFTWAYMHEQRKERARVDARLTDLEQAALARGAVIEALFVGQGGDGVAVFGVAGATRVILFSRQTYVKERVQEVEFDRVAAAFARPDGENRYRLEVRTHSGNERAALFLRLESREEAERWVQVLKPHLGERARFVETSDE